MSRDTVRRGEDVLLGKGYPAVHVQRGVSRGTGAVTPRSAMGGAAAPGPLPARSEHPGIHRAPSDPCPTSRPNAGAPPRHRLAPERRFAAHSGPSTPLITMMSMLRAAATSVAGSAANRLRARGSFLAPLSPQVLAAPSGSARPYRYTPPVQVRCQRFLAMGGGGGPAAAPSPRQRLRRRGRRFAPRRQMLAPLPLLQQASKQSSPAASCC